MLGALLTLGTLPFSTGCRDSSDSTAMSRESYIDLYVEILQAADSAEDTLAAFRRAHEILAEHGFSQDDLDAFAKRYAGDPDYLAAVWGEIEQRLRNPSGQDDDADDVEDVEDVEDAENRPEDAGAARS